MNYYDDIDIFYWKLLSVSGVGHRTIVTLKEKIRESENDINLLDLFELPLETVANEYSIDDDKFGKIQQAVNDVTLNEELIAYLYEMGVSILSLENPAFPDKLLALGDKNPVSLVFTIGNNSLLSGKSVAIIGSRNANENELQVAANIARSCAEEGVTVISGNARGVDRTAQSGALESNGAVISILPEGITPYLKSGDYRSANLEQFVLVSQFLPNAPWSAANAFARNRTITDIADAVVVITASESGGSIHGGKTALKSAKLFAVDYSGTSTNPTGNGLLLKYGGLPLKSDLSDIASLFEFVYKEPSLVSSSYEKATSNKQIGLF